MIVNAGNQQVANMRILYFELPVEPGDCFVQVRQWETANRESSDLIVEYGRMGENGDLQTECRVVPFFWSVREVLAVVGN